MINIVAIAVLLAITYEDFRYRAVRIIFFPVLMTTLIVSRLSTVPNEIFLVDILINVAYLFFLLGVGFAFLRIRNAMTIKSIGNFIGLGDLFMMIAIACWLDPVSFVVFNTISLSLALVFHFIFRRFTTLYNQYETIPLAGFQSICFLVVFIIGLDTI